MLKFQVYTDAKGEYRWRLLAGNNESIATSGEGYRDLKDCKHAISLIQKDAATAKVVEAAAKPKTKAAPKKAAASADASATPATPGEAATTAAPKKKSAPKKKAAPKKAAPKAKKA